MRNRVLIALSVFYCVIYHLKWVFLGLYKKNKKKIIMLNINNEV